jgi:membrane-bound lytic murein transglycosylase D
MIKSHRSLRLAVYTPFSLFLLLGGCATTNRTQSFAMSFLPASPPPDALSSSEPPPNVGPSAYPHESPNLLQHIIAAQTALSDTDVRIHKADESFEAGKRAYQAGDAGAARKEFDRALDVLLSAPDGTPPERARLEKKLDQLVDRIYRYDLEGLGAGEVREEVAYDKRPFDEILQMTFPTDLNLKPKVKEEINATASQLPLEATDAVLSYINFFSTDAGKRTVIAGLKRSGRYRDLIQHILDEEGVPRELMYLAQIESGFYARAQSYMAAVGMWQFIVYRGREYGLQQTAYTDDRLDPAKATRAAAKHLHDLYNEFGDWYLAMAAYNCGPMCVDKAVQRTGFADFWELRSHNALPRETMNYVPAIVALTIVSKNPKDYGLDNVELDSPLDYDTISVQCPTNLTLVADALDRPLTDLQELNPSLLRPLAPAGYELRVPKGTAAATTAAIENIPEIHRAEWRLHRVQTGETIADIAKHYATFPQAILQANAAQRNGVQGSVTEVTAPEAGDLLVIPAAGRPAPRVVLARRAYGRAAKTMPAPALAANAKRTPVQSTRAVAYHAPAAVNQRVIQHRAAPRTPKTAAIAHARSAN